MTRPFRAGVGVAVLTGLLAGCARAPDEQAGTGSTPSARAELPPSAWADTGIADGLVLPPAPGEVGLVRGGFDKVEAALNAAKGKVVLIDCWATWCGPCVLTFPLLVEKHRKYADRGLAVISLSLDKPADAGQAVQFLRQQKATFTNLHLTTVDAAARKGMVERFAFRNALPHAVLLDKAGARVWVGHPMDPALGPKIEAELAK
jgi:thiol-disulfide isomerase/thioredoxin